MSKRKNAGKRPKQREAIIVEADCTDEVLRNTLAEKVPGWSELRPKQQSELMQRMRSFQAAVQPSPRMSLTDVNGARSIGVPDDENVTLHALRAADTFATRSSELVDDRIKDLASFARPGSKHGLSPGSDELNASLAFVAGGQPKDPVQSTLLVQMDATHNAAMRALDRGARAEFIQQAQMWGNLSVKLLNAFTRQAEVLAKLQRGGEQVVKHIHIDNRGGQALVTEQVVTGGGVKSKVGEQPHEQCTHGPALLGTDPLGNVVPMPSLEGQEAVQTARRRVTRSAEG